MVVVELTELQEHVRGTKRGWVATRAEEGEDMLLGFDIIRGLTEKRSAMEARLRKSGAVAR
jgi:hypothetical protein